ncbi:MAG: hypothetical protein WA040_03805 [Anaerolineae bacterium]
MQTPEALPVIAAPYQETFGMFRDDPTFADFLAEVQKYRRQGNGPEVQLLGEVELLPPGGCGAPSHTNDER